MQINLSINDYQKTLNSNTKFIDSTSKDSNLGFIFNESNELSFLPYKYALNFQITLMFKI